MDDPRPDGLPQRGDIVAGKYRVERVLGKGGMGIVLAAEHLALQQTIALKFLLPEAAERAPEIVERFLREARIAASLRNEHVARVMDVGVLGDGTPYLVMEYLTGTDLQALLEERKRLPAEEAIDYLLQACEALAEVHQAGLVHRDLKPSNLFLAEGTGGVPAIKVLDFGISKVVAAVERGLTETGMVVGTVAYMAPEQLLGSKEIDARADIWALGVTLYQILTGRLPFEGVTLPAQLIAITSGPPPPFKDLGIEAPEGLEEVILRCLEKDPARRPQAVADLAVTLQPFGTTVAWMAAERILLVHPESRGERRPPPASAKPRSVAPAPDADAEAPEPSLRAPEPSEPRPSSGRRARSRRAMRLGLLAAVLGAGLATIVTLLVMWQRAASLRAAAQIDIERLASFAPLPPAPPGRESAASVARVKLGRALFHEPKLSRNGDISCNSCHPLDRYGVDGKRLSRGTADREPPRNSLSVYNTSDFFAMLWDGRKQTLEDQAEDVLAAPYAMDMPMDKLGLVVAQMPGYAGAFEEAFPEESQPASARGVVRALAAFQGTLVTRGRWDRFLEGDKDALTPEEKAGFNRFVDVGCVSCHFGASVGATMLQKVGLVKAWPNTRDRGLYETTRRQADWMVFRVPSLRNVAETGPYFHDGSVTSLEEAIRMMARHQIGRELSASDVELILAWLGSLTGELPEGAGAPTAAPD